MYFGDYHRIEVKHLFDYITTDHNAFNISAIDKHMFVWVLYIYIYLKKYLQYILTGILGRCPGEGNGNALQYSYLGNAMDRGAWWVIVHGVTEELDMT